MCCLRSSTLVIVLLASLTTRAFAGPPYLTDDPEPVPYRHWEFYTFMTQDKTLGGRTTTGPALELNNGIARNTQLHLVIPEISVSEGGSRASGLGDIEAGVKYRLVAETKIRPEIGIFPQLELPSGNQSRGLGNGRVWGKAPLWLQKSWGQWTSYGGGGYAINPAPGQRDYFYGGLLIQRTLSKRLTLGDELFFQGASVPGARSSSFWNTGGSFNFTPDFSLLFSVGHSFQGDSHRLLYLGLYRTWGPGSP